MRRGRPPKDSNAIRAAAIELFTNKGFTATTVDDIAAAAGVSPRTVFRHYPTKADIAATQSVDNLETVGRIVREQPPNIPMGEAISRIALGVAEALDDNPSFSRVRPEYENDPAFARRRAELVYVEGPKRLAWDFAAREGSSEPTLEHLTAARLTICILDLGLDRWLRNQGDSVRDAVSHALSDQRRMFT